MARVKTTVRPDNGGEYIILPEMRNGMLCWREVATN